MLVPSINYKRNIRTSSFKLQVVSLEYVVSLLFFFSSLVNAKLVREFSFVRVTGAANYAAGYRGVFELEETGA